MTRHFEVSVQPSARGLVTGEHDRHAVEPDGGLLQAGSSGAGQAGEVRARRVPIMEFTVEFTIEFTVDLTCSPKTDSEVVRGWTS
jgi:hypothetical protein